MTVTPAGSLTGRQGLMETRLSMADLTGQGASVWGGGSEQASECWVAGVQKGWHCTEQVYRVRKSSSEGQPL